ncbi:hypothetical protein Tco_1082408 [Tanacetum coccineum]|uniref:Uncharacterized protein n=1 Tax=Tanacetum coccineum TaxID=301880 RepID=A0ABQ5I2F6_9ASTR
MKGIVHEGTQETNINAGTQDHDSDSEVDEQVIVVPSFPSNSFAGPSSSNGPSVMNAMQIYAVLELAKLQRHGSCWLDSAGGVAGRGWGGVVLLLVVILLVYIVSVDLFLFNADESTLPPGQSLGSSENTTRFPVPSDVCKDQLSSGIFTSSSYDDDFSATLTNLAPAVEKENPMDVKSALSPMEEIEKSHNYEEVLLTRPLFHQKIPGIYFGYRFLWKDIILGSINKAWALCEGFGRYVKDMLTKFDMESVRTATTPYEAAKTKLKDETDPPVNVHLYRSMIGSLMYLTASRPDIMFAVSACSRHQVTPLTSHLNAVKKIFKYLKGQPKLGLWYPKDSPFQLEAYSDSDYAGSHGDRKSTTGGCQFLGRRLISWQCKKQTIVATSSTEAEYVAAASCCAQVLWIQNQLLDYGFNFMNTKIFIDNQSTICIVKNPVFHQRTKHIEIRHHFIRDANEKNLIQVLKIHTDDNVADLLTKAFDRPRFEYLVVHIGMVNPSFVNCGEDFFSSESESDDDMENYIPPLLLIGFVYAVNTSIYAAELFDIAGRLVSAIVHYISLLWLSPNHAGAITLYLLNE